MFGPRSSGLALTVGLTVGCGESGEPLSQRADDTKDALQSRLKGYHEMTTPLLEHYKPVVKLVDAAKKPAEIFPQVDTLIANYLRF